MKKIFEIAFKNKRTLTFNFLIIILCFSFSPKLLNAQTAGFNNTYIILNFGAKDVYYDLNAATANADFNGASLGEFCLGATNELTFKGAEHNVYKCGGCDLSSTNLRYRIYVTGSPSGSFISNNITYSSEFVNGCGGKDQIWEKTDYSTNLLTSLNAGNYTLEVYSDASTTCLGTVYASNGGSNYKATFTVLPVSFTWQGGANGAVNDWNTPANWSPTSVPTSCADVTIPSGLTNYPTLSASGTCNNITIASGASLLDNGHLTVNGTASVDRTISGIAEAWHLLSSPVASQSISDVFTPTGTYTDGSGYDFFAWDEASGTWFNQKVSTHSINSFIPGKGYLVAYQASNPTKTFVGNLNSGTISFPLTILGTGTYAKANLAGNPYPSSIDWKSASGWTKTSLSEVDGGHTIHIYNQTKNNYGVYSDANSGDVGTNGVTRYIAPMQGFFVTAASAGDLTIDNTTRVHSSQSWLKSGTEQPFRIRVTAPEDKGSDEISLEFGHTTSEGGAAKWFSFVETAPGLYTPKSGSDYSISFLTSISENPVIPVSFKAGVDGNYSLSADFNSATYDFVQLEDTKTQTFYDLKSAPLFVFDALKTDDPNRFLIHFLNTTGTNKPLSSTIKVYSATGKINILGVDGKAEILIRNIMGQVVLSNSVKGSTLQSLNTNNLPAGVYVVSVVSGKQTVSEKVVIK